MNLAFNYIHLALFLADILVVALWVVPWNPNVLIHVEGDDMLEGDLGKRWFCQLFTSKICLNLGLMFEK